MEVGSFVRTLDGIYAGYIFKVEEIRNAYNPWYCTVRDRNGLKIAEQVLRPSTAVEVPADQVTFDLAEQSCFQDAKEHLKIGQRVKFTRIGANVAEYGRVYSFRPTSYHWSSRTPVGAVEIITGVNYGGEPETYLTIWDKVTVEEKNPDDYVDANGCVPFAFDFLTDEPIYDQDQAVELYDGVRTNLVLGVVDKDTLGEGWEICEHCGKAVIQYRADDSGTTVCEDCFENYYFICEDCGSIIHMDDCYTTDDDCQYCEDCYDRHNCSDLLHEYGYNPSEFYFRDYVGGREERFADWQDFPPKPYMGVELEIDKGFDRNECLSDLGRNIASDMIYCKEDGSLSGTGIEIVTHPCTLAYHMERFPWEEICDTATSNGYRSHDTDTCGLHVHVSRNWLGDTETDQDLTVAKIMILMDKFWKKLVVFSRRNVDRLNHWAAKPDAKINRKDTVRSAIRKANATKSGGHSARYHALNITNSDTIEFRLFRGSLKYKTIIASLQLVSNIVSMAKNRTLLEMQDATWESLVHFVQYDELDQYLAEHHLDDYTDEPLGDVEPEEDVPLGQGDEVICTIVGSEPFTGIVSEPINNNAFIVRDVNNPNNWRIAFADEMRMSDTAST